MLKGGEQAHCVKEQQTCHKQMQTTIFYILQKKKFCVLFVSSQKHSDSSSCMPTLAHCSVLMTGTVKLLPAG